ncbi:MAG TPA: serine acetyltransferase, partial [Polyangiaceae bacterium]|nr:serine acetyltransferase [Polyangiaceae bacterium]
MSSPALRVVADTHWDLGRVVNELRRSRHADKTQPDGESRLVTHQLPSRAALLRVASGLTAALFPSHFGPPDLT